MKERQHQDIMKKWGDFQLALQLGFELPWPFTTHYNSTYLYRCECYQTRCMNCNRCNSPYVKLYTYVAHATHLQLFNNYYCAILMQLVYNYNILPNYVRGVHNC